MTNEKSIDTLKSFYDLMAQTQKARSGIVNRLMTSGCFDRKQTEALKSALFALEGCLEKDYRASLFIDGPEAIEVDLTYEISELKKDICYLDNGEERFMSYLESIHPDFLSHVEAGVELLGGKHFNCFITDRDGTVNNYCGRYRSSIQSVYNAVFLTRFAGQAVSSPIIITSAPLKDVGIIDVSTTPENAIIFAASKGREFIDLSGRRRGFPIDDYKQALIDRLNGELSEQVKDPAYEKFTLIGSGLQFKFGQTTIARQDINGSIPKDASDAFLALIRALVERVDPTNEHFRIEDTGLDIEIILTISDEEAGPKDFDKADAVAFLDKELNLDMGLGPHLVCGDTGSDVPMLQAVMDRTPDTWSVFVTRDETLSERVKAVCPNAVIVPEPDMLITILNRLAQDV